jgi:cytochrome c5
LKQEARSQEPEARIVSGRRCKQPLPNVRGPALRFALALGLLVNGAAAADKLPAGDGKRLVETTCSSCHDIDVVTSKSYTKERWRSVVDAMISEGAPLSKAEAARVVEYLAKHFGEKERAKELYEEICSYCHELERITRQSLTREEWRGLIKGMVDEGAPVTSEEFSLIVDYLAEHFGPSQEGAREGTPPDGRKRAPGEKESR